jgi:hypothetical protein
LDNIVETGLLAITPLAFKEVRPAADRFATMMTDFNIWGQTSLMLDRLQAQKNHYASLACTLDAANQSLDHRIAELSQEKEQLLVAEMELEAKKREWRDKSKQMSSLASEVQALQSKDHVVETARKKGIFDRKRPARTPSIGNSNGIPA